MEKKMQLQKIMVILYFIMAGVAFVYSLCFATAYKDLFGLILPANKKIAEFHDTYLQNFNQIMFWFTLFGAASIAFFYIFQIRSYVADLPALLFTTIPLLIVCGFSVYALTYIPVLKDMYLSLDYSTMALEGMSDYAVTTGPFTFGMVLFSVNIVINLMTIFSEVSCHFSYKKLQKEIA